MPTLMPAAAVAQPCIAALFVESGGCYFGLPGVDPWDQSRDARGYEGPAPVVAHPPCSAWCRLAPVNLARWGKGIGEDEGCFASALESVRRWGGVLEHPAGSLAWKAFDLPMPVRGGWAQRWGDEGLTTEVDQAAYGHPARKRTWLYAVGCDLPELRWFRAAGEAMIGNGIKSGEGLGRRKLGKVEASATPVAFRETLLAIARSAYAPW